MDTLVISAGLVRELLSPEDCIEALEAALTAAARGDVVQPLRAVAWRPDAQGAVAGMPGYIGEPAVLGAKVIAVFPDNRQRGKPSHQGIVVLHDPTDGRLMAIIDAGEITAIRTAAASALATRLLAREDASVLALLGTGVQAREHLRALRTVRPIREVRVWSRTPDHAQEFARRSEAVEGLRVLAVSTAERAVRGAEIVCTLTAARSPVLRGEWLMQGAHVNAVGASTRAFRELDAQAVARSRLFADSAASLRAESADYLGALEEGAIDGAHLIGELEELVTGSVPGRTDPAQITLFKSLGLALEDLAAAQRVFDASVAQGRGVHVEIGAPH